MASLVAQAVKDPPAVRETRVQSRGREAPLEKEMAPHSSILAWRLPWTEEPGGLQLMVLRSDIAKHCLTDLSVRNSLLPIFFNLLIQFYVSLNCILNSLWVVYFFPSIV